MKRRAYAKINLTLDVLGRREDGYHDLSMVMVPLQLHDLLSIEIAEEDSFACNVKYLGNNEHNSIIKAIGLMKERYGIKEHFKIELLKYIPMQAGLGGGSSNAAATIILLNQMLQLRLSQKELQELADSIGKDVTYCLYSRPALVEGTGEKVTFITNNCEFGVLLVKPSAGVATGEAYLALDQNPYQHYPPAPMIAALAAGDYEAMVHNLGNSLCDASKRLLPLIGKIERQLKEFGFDGVLMSGSGSCVFATTQDSELLERAAEHFRKQYYFVFKTKVRRGKYG